MDCSLTTWGALSTSADLWPDKCALRDPDRSLTYAQSLSAVTRVCGGLRSIGVGRGTVVAVMLDNHVDHALLWFATGSLGAIECGLNPQLRGDLLLDCLNDAGAEVLVIEAAYAAEFANILSRVPKLRTVVVRPGEAGTTPPAPNVKTHTWSDIADAPAFTDLGHVDGSDIFGMIYTSGSSGRPKGVLVTHAQTYMRCEPGSLGTPTGSDVSLVTLPMFHVVGLCRGVYSTLISGGTSVILPKFSASRFWEQAHQHGATCAPLLGSMASFIFAQGPADNDRGHGMRWVTMAPPITAVDQFRERFGVEVYTAYGLTEAVALTSGRASGRGTGWLRPDFEMRLVDDFDRERPAGQIGELIVRAKQPWLTMIGYHNRCDATQEMFRNQWLHTGDLFEVLDTGELHFIGRKNERIRRRGENIPAGVIESSAARHEQINAAFAVAVPDDENVEDEILLCVVSTAPELEPETIHRFIAEALPAFMVPRYILILSDLPVTSSQKVDRAKLRQQLSRAWDVRKQARSA
jgi:crotonobetaine/carnitine-CoA ligase